MTKIVDLPREIFELIFAHLTTTTTHWGHPTYQAAFAAGTASHLRLVCRPWADWLYEHHLYRSLVFDTASRSLVFIDFLSRRLTNLPRAKCQYLEVDFLWASRHPPWTGQTEMITSDILESLLELFSDTIITLDLRIIDFFTLPSRTIKVIGEIKHLSHLQLHLSRWQSGDLELHEAHPSCYNFLITEVRGLKSLCLAIPVSLPSEPDVEVAYQSPDVILGLSIALKPSLKSLSIHDFGQIDDVQLFLPVYETLRETIEGLSVTITSSLAPMLNLHFPKLRVLAVYGWHDSVIDFLSQEMLSQSPIESIVISSFSAKGSTAAFAVNPFLKLPQLRKLVFMKTPSNYTPAPMYLRAFEDCHVQCVYLELDEMPPLMKL